MAKLDQLITTLRYARLGLVSLSVTIVPITAAAQEICASDFFEGEPDAANLMNQTIVFLDVLKDNGVIAFEGAEGRLTVDSAKQALVDGVGSFDLLNCVVNSDSIEFADGAGSKVISCGNGGGASVARTSVGAPSPSSSQMFCTTETATVAQYLGSEA